MPPEVEHAPTAAASWQQHMIDTGEGLRQPPEGQNHRARSRTPLRTAPPPAGKMVLRVSAAEADLWVKAVRMAVGDYAIFDSCHGTTNFRKSEKSGTDGSGVSYLYFWDTGDDRTGWWFGEVIGGDLVLGYAKGDRWGPPTTGWKFPWDGKERKSVTCTLADQSGLMTTALPTGDPEPKPPPWRQCANGTTLPPPPVTAPAPPPVKRHSRRRRQGQGHMHTACVARASEASEAHCTARRKVRLGQPTLASGCVAGTTARIHHCANATAWRSRRLLITEQPCRT